MDDLDCGRHAESHHGSALPESQYGRRVRAEQSVSVRFCRRTL